MVGVAAEPIEKSSGMRSPGECRLPQCKPRSWAHHVKCGKIGSVSYAPAQPPGSALATELALESMTMRQLPLILAVIVLSAAHLRAAEPPTQPNILLIL